MEEKQLLLRLQPQDLCCTICYNLYNYPTTLPCGHTFCKVCIEKFWESQRSTKCECPLCKKSFQTKPVLCKNTDIAQLLDTVQELDSKAHEQCQHCIGDGALKLCLSCMAPLCTNHLVLHSGQRHLLVNLITTTWPCKRHEKGLQYFCMSHSSPVCSMCVSQHKECQTFQLLELYTRKKEEIKKRITDLEITISSKERSVASQKEIYCEAQIFISDIKDKLTKNFREMREYIEKQERASFWRMKQEQDTAQKQSSERIQHLTADIDVMKKLRGQLEDQLENDCIAVLKGIGSENIYRPTSSAERQNIIDENRLADTSHNISQMKKNLLSHPLLEHLHCPPKQVLEDTLVLPTEPSASCTQEMNVRVAEKGPRKLLQWATTVSFDGDTVNYRLSLSEDFKTVTVTGKNQYPKHERRFTLSQVLCAEGFSTECSYWEIDTNNSDGWSIGAAALEIENHGQLGRNHLSWCVEWNKEQLSAWHKNENIMLDLPKPSVVGVLLKCAEKVISFYSITAESEILLQSYKLNFQTRIFPAVWLYGLKKGNSLTICDINRQ
ncbi:E3 ubiquitin-protein ligase RNF135-like [Pseudophryne corroboree]|uniref:E3 ubiquitin-protein ligase RNF135-like n=1 Tax=Pseudophryne corroboree TaxID=495146 RepID=UPI00308155CD